MAAPIAVGTIDAILTRTGATLEPVYDELLEQTRAAGALNVDETGWYLGGESRTLWGAFSKRTAVWRIAPDRGKQHLLGLIGEGFAGVVGSDRFSAYNSLEPERRQVCWSHLRRDFTFHADLGSGPREAFGLDGLEVTWNVFHSSRVAVAGWFYMTSTIGKRGSASRQAAANSAVPTSPLKSE